MDNLSKALAIAIQYLSITRNDDDFTEDDDIKVVEEISAVLQELSKEEKESLLKAIKQLDVPELAENLGI